MKKVLSVRMPDELYEKVKATATERGQSINCLVNEALKRVVKEKERQELYDAFTYLGKRFGSQSERMLPLTMQVMAEHRARFVRKPE